MDKTTKDGGPAFPRTAANVQDERGLCVDVGDTGMTLRDYFAAKAMPAIYADLSRKLMVSKVIVESVYEIVAITSFEMADAMLRARKAL